MRAMGCRQLLACWYCEHFKSIDPRSSTVACSRKGWSKKAKDGCEAYERVPGVDDEEGSPLMPRIAPTVSAPSPPARARSRGIDGWWTEPVRPGRAAAPQRVVPILVPARDPFGALFSRQDD